MEPVSEWIHHRFPAVRSLGTDAVEQLLREDRERLLLLDVRSPAEYEVSHLEGAVRVDPETTDMEQVVRELGPAECLKDKEVVCYCTAGYHGSEMAQKLHKALVSGSEQEGQESPKVYNLDGGLVKWANERKPIVDGKEQPTQLVHPYNKVWAQLLEPELRAPI
ncbi:tRNA uridine(34) hydroxylase-like [Pristis pectinata]|uniref:tRNA uridine(34) hydroxylase-like n=1 Tax=Pristis pectinata TaxID=685728 RepID=UPI00223D4DC4|nr:tRNA uridine(34) hydroxylase-like [Pristis pectinata]